MRSDFHRVYGLPGLNSGHLDGSTHLFVLVGQVLNASFIIIKIRIFARRIARSKMVMDLLAMMT